MMARLFTVVASVFLCCSMMVRGSGSRFRNRSGKTARDREKAIQELVGANRAKCLECLNEPGGLKNLVARLVREYHPDAVTQETEGGIIGQVTINAKEVNLREFNYELVFERDGKLRDMFSKITNEALRERLKILQDSDILHDSLHSPTLTSFMDGLVGKVRQCFKDMVSEILYECGCHRMMSRDRLDSLSPDGDFSYQIAHALCSEAMHISKTVSSREWTCFFLKFWIPFAIIFIPFFIWLFCFLETDPIESETENNDADPKGKDAENPSPGA